MDGNAYRRRIVVVDKKFQFGISGRIVSYLAAYFLFFFMLAVFAPFLVSVLEGGSQESTNAALSELVKFANRLFVPLLLTFVCLALHTVLLTHRIAGPVYRFRKMFEGVRDGEISRDVNLRKGDYLNALAEAYNVSMTKLRSDFDELRIEAAGLAAGQTEDVAEARLRGERMLRIIGHYHTGTEGQEPEPESVDVVEQETPAPAEA